MNNFSNTSRSDYSHIFYKSQNIRIYDKKFFNELYLIKAKRKKERNSILDLFHSSVLSRKFNIYARPKINLEYNIGRDNSDLSFFLTKIENSESNHIKTTTTNESSKVKNFIENFKGNQIKNKIKLSNENLNLEKYRKPFSFNEPISDCLEQGKKLNTISNFINKIRVIRRFRINKGMQEYNFLSINENELLQSEILDKIIYNRNLAKKYLEEYLYTMNNYNLYLYGIINKGREILSEILTYQNELQLNIIQIFSQINKKEKILDQCKQYKIFLLLVKFNVKDITLIPENDLKKYGIEITKKNKNKKENENENENKILILKHNSKKIKKKFDNNRFIMNNLKKPKHKRSSVFETDNLIFEQEIGKHSNPEIFESPEDFYYQFQYLDNYLRKLIEKLHDTKKEINELIEKKNETEKIIYDEEFNNPFINEYERDLKALKDKNDTLTKKKAYIKRTYQNNIKTISQNLIFSHIKSILMKYPINIETQMKMIGFYQNINTKLKEILIKGKNYNKCLYGLKALEFIFLHFSNIIREYKSDPKRLILFKNIVYSLDQKKKLQKNEENKYKEIKRRERIAQKVIEKSKKIIIVAKRKVDKYEDLLKMQIQLEKEEKESLKKIKKVDDTKYEPWISY